MKTSAFIITFNESDIIEFTVKHYQKFCDEIHIYDNFSTDNTVEICKSLGCIIHTFGQKGILDDRAYLNVKNDCWKHHDCDWAIVCDADEILYFDKKILEDENGILVIPQGYNMVSESLPVDSWDEIKIGYPESMYSKWAMFNKNYIAEMNYNYGCHKCSPIPKDKKYDKNVYINNSILSHMRYVGGAERLKKRYEMYKHRMSDFNINNKLGYQYQFNQIQIQQDYDRAESLSFEITNPWKK